MHQEKDPNEIGALWLKESAKGTKYMKGVIDGIGPVVIFKNQNKRGDKSPDYKVMKSQPKPAEQPKPQPTQTAVEDDIPFAVFLPLVLIPVFPHIVRFLA